MKRQYILESKCENPSCLAAVTIVTKGGPGKKLEDNSLYRPFAMRLPSTFSRF